MSRIIEGSLEILRPMEAAVKEEESDDMSTQLSSAAHNAGQNEQQPARTSHDHDHEEEENGSDDDSFAETDESSDPEHEEEEDDSLILAVGGRKRVAINRKKASNEAKWQTRLQLLRKYRKQHGHCRVPQICQMDGVELGNWIRKQRVEYKKHVEGKPSQITQERIDQLEAVGYDFHYTKQKREKVQWQTKLALLRQYKYRERNGHCQAPQRYEFDGVKLGIWLANQKAEYGKHSRGEPSCITQERIEQLEAVGVDFHYTKQKKDEAQWQSKLELLREYREQNGHCNVPKRYEINGVNLGRWIQTQRHEYKKRIDGKPDAWITQQRIIALNAIGLEWSPKTSMNAGDGTSSGNERTPAMTRSSRRFSRRTRVTDLYSGATTSAIFAKSLRSKMQKSSQSKSPRPDDQGGMNEPSVDDAAYQKERTSVLVHGLSKRMPIATTCLTRRKKVASTGGKSTKMTPLRNRLLRKRGATAAGHSANTCSVPERSSLRQNRGKRKRNAPEHYCMLDPTRSQAPVATQSPAKVKASHGKNSRSATCHSSKRTVSEHPQSANNLAVESPATATTTDISWDEHFDRLVEFKWNHGHCRVPVEFCVDDSYYLGQWVVVQRLQHNRLVDGRPSSIAADQVSRLNAIGFVWRAR